MTDKIAEHNIVLLKYHEAHPEVSLRRLGKLFGISKARAGQLIRRDKRDRMVVEYFMTHPGASPAEAKLIFHISEHRVRSLMPADALVYPQL